jgi:hypothetical protein
VIHVVNSINLPPSVTRTVYDLIASNPAYTNLDNLLRAILFDELLATLYPVTLFAPPDAVLKDIPITEISSVLENHIFEGLLYFDQLLTMDGQVITSINEKKWTVSVLDSSIFLQAEKGGSVVSKVQNLGDILGNNGILHNIDAPLLEDSNVTLLVEDSNVTLAPTAGAPTSSISSPTAIDTNTSTTPSPSPENLTDITPRPSNPKPSPTLGPSATSETPSPSSEILNDITPGLSPTPTRAPATTNVTFVRINTVFTVFNTEGLKAEQVSPPPHAGVLNKAFSDFVEILVADVEAVRHAQNPPKQARQLRVTWRRLDAALERSSVSPSVYGIQDVACPADKEPPIPNNASCQDLYGKYELAVTDEDPQAVKAAYSNATDKAVQDGKLQDSLKRTAPTSPFVVIGPVSKEEGGGEMETTAPEDEKMPWWMILIIVLSCVLACCCIVGSELAYFSMRNKKPKAEELEERLLDTTDGTPPDALTTYPIENTQRDDPLERDEDDSRHLEQTHRDTWRDDESVNVIQEEEISAHDGETQPDWEDESDGGDDDNDVQGSLVSAMSTTIAPDSDYDTEHVQASPYQEDGEWLGDDASADGTATADVPEPGNVQASDYNDEENAFENEEDEEETGDNDMSHVHASHGADPPATETDSFSGPTDEADCEGPTTSPLGQEHSAVQDAEDDDDDSQAAGPLPPLDPPETHILDGGSATFTSDGYEGQEDLLAAHVIIHQTSQDGYSAEEWNDEEESAKDESDEIEGDKDPTNGNSGTSAGDGNHRERGADVESDMEESGVVRESWDDEANEADQPAI